MTRGLRGVIMRRRLLNPFRSRLLRRRPVLAQGSAAPGAACRSLILAASNAWLWADGPVVPRDGRRAVAVLRHGARRPPLRRARLGRLKVDLRALFLLHGQRRGGGRLDSIAARATASRTGSRSGTPPPEERMSTSRHSHTRRRSSSAWTRSPGCRPFASWPGAASASSGWQGIPVIRAAGPTPACGSSSRETAGDELDRRAGRRGRPSFEEPPVLFPCTDLSVLAISLHRDALASAYRSVLPPPRRDRACCSTRPGSTAYASGAGLPVAPTQDPARPRGRRLTAAETLRFPLRAQARGQDIALARAHLREGVQSRHAE